MEKSLKAEWLEQATQWHDMYCHDLEVMRSNSSWVEVGVRSRPTSVLSYLNNNNSNNNNNNNNNKSWTNKFLYSTTIGVGNIHATDILLFRILVCESSNDGCVVYSVSAAYTMFCHDLEVLGLSPTGSNLGVHSPKLDLTKIIYNWLWSGVGCIKIQHFRSWTFAPDNTHGYLVRNGLFLVLIKEGRGWGGIHQKWGFKV